MNFINFLAFLFNGEYRTVSERFCGISFNYINVKYVRYLDFELLNRTIIWNILSNFLIFIIPLASNLSFIKDIFVNTTFLGNIEH